MCLHVKEGEYAPAPAYVAGQSGPFAAIRTFAKESLTLRHYWYQFLSSVLTMMAASAGVFMLFFYQSTGLNLHQIGRVAGCTTVAVGLLIPVSGWLADRYHPIRVVIAGYLMSILVVYPAAMIWFFWHPSPNVAFWVWIVIMVGLTAPAAAIMGVQDPPLLMRIFPRDRYGQFCSANAMLRSIGAVVAGILAGVFFDVIKHHVAPGQVYHFIPVWQLILTVPSFICVTKLYKSWKRYGGDAGYTPPVPGSVSASEESSVEPLASLR